MSDRTVSATAKVDHGLQLATSNNEGVPARAQLQGERRTRRARVVATPQ